MRVVENDVVKMQVGLEHPPLESGPFGAFARRVECRFSTSTRCAASPAASSTREGSASITTRPDDRRRLDELARVHKRSKPLGAGRRRNPIAFPCLVHD